MSLKMRVRALERVVGRTDDQRCEACGHGPGCGPSSRSPCTTSRWTGPTSAPSAAGA